MRRCWDIPIWNSEKGFAFLPEIPERQAAFLEELEEARNVKDGDTVRMYGLEFDYYK